MDINKGAVGIFLALCIIGGATGFYLGTSDRPTPVVAATSDDVAPPAEPEPTVPTERAPASRALNKEPVRPAAVAQPAAAVDRRPARVLRTVSERPQPAAVQRSASPPASDRPLVSAVSGPPAVPRLETPRAPAATTAPTSRDTADTTPVERATPAEPDFVELTIPADAVIGLQVETALTSERAQVEDEVVAHVTRDVRAGDRVAIPSGATAHGQVTLVERGGRLRDRARLGIRFTSIVLADGTRVPLATETIYREGDSPGGESAAKIGGGAIGGAIIGGIFGGAKGAAIGGSVGAGAGTAAVYAGGRNAATLPNGTPLTVRLIEPATVTVEH
jgi:hypothetical protein